MGKNKRGWWLGVQMANGEHEVKAWSGPEMIGDADKIGHKRD